MRARWYEVELESVQGPVSYERVRALILSGKLSSATRVRSSLVRHWEIAAGIEELAPLFRLQPVHWLIPAVLLPVGLLMLWLAWVQSTVDYGPIAPREQAEVGFWLTLGGAFATLTGVIIPAGEQFVQWRQLQRQKARQADDDGQGSPGT